MSLFSLGREVLMSFFALAGVMVPVLIRGMELSGGVQSRVASLAVLPGVSLLCCCPKDRSKAASSWGSGAAVRGGAGGSSPGAWAQLQASREAVSTGDVSFEGSALMSTGSQRCEGAQLLPSPSGGSGSAPALAVLGFIWDML